MECMNKDTGKFQHLQVCHTQDMIHNKKKRIGRRRRRVYEDRRESVEGSRW